MTRNSNTSMTAFRELISVFNDTGQINQSNFNISILDLEHDYMFSNIKAIFKQMSKNGTLKGIDLDQILNVIDMYNVKKRAEVNNSCSYCDGNMRDVITAYNDVHGYVSLFVCILGTFANILNIAVLTRKDMASAPINRILKWLAVTDMLVMLEYIPFAVYRYLVLPGKLDFPRPWAAYLLFHVHFSQVLHTTSISLTLSLAIWRYIAIKYPHLNHILCTARRCSIAVLSSFLLPLFLCIPNYLLFRIHTTTLVENGTTYTLYHLDADQEGPLWHTNFWTHAVIIKLLPCLILTIISIWLISALYNADRRKLALKSYNQCGNSSNSGQKDRKQTKSSKRTDRTTKMLIAVLILFLITEFPQGILGLLSGIIGECFFKTCYNLFGELMDILALLNGAINFILYCTMSKQFRITFGLLFKPKILAKWPTNGSQTEVQSTCV